MAVKVIAIGNLLMGDDGIAVYIAGRLKKMLANDEIDIIIGETDFEYCMDRIEPEDFVIVLDSAALGLEPGAVSLIPFEEFCCANAGIWEAQHETSLFKLLAHYHDIEKIGLIGIEAESIQLGCDLSGALKTRMDSIAGDVRKAVLAVLADRYELKKPRLKKSPQ